MVFRESESSRAWILNRKCISLLLGFEGTWLHFISGFRCHQPAWIIVRNEIAPIRDFFGGAAFQLPASEKRFGESVEIAGEGFWVTFISQSAVNHSFRTIGVREKSRKMLAHCRFRSGGRLVPQGFLRNPKKLDNVLSESLVVLHLVCTRFFTQWEMGT